MFSRNFAEFGSGQ